jgi:Hemingway/CFA97
MQFRSTDSACGAHPLVGKTRCNAFGFSGVTACFDLQRRKASAAVLAMTALLPKRRSAERSLHAKQLAHRRALRNAISCLDTSVPKSRQANARVLFAQEAVRMAVEEDNARLIERMIKIASRQVRKHDVSAVSTHYMSVMLLLAVCTEHPYCTICSVYCTQLQADNKGLALPAFPSKLRSPSHRKEAMRVARENALSARRIAGAKSSLSRDGLKPAYFRSPHIGLYPRVPGMGLDQPSLTSDDVLAPAAAAAAAVRAEQRGAAGSPRRANGRGGGGGCSSSTAAGKRITAAELFKPASVHGARPPARGSPSRGEAPGRRRASAPYRTAASAVTAAASASAASAAAVVDTDADANASVLATAAAEVCAPLDWPAHMFKGGPGSSSGAVTCGASSAFSRSDEGAAGSDRAVLFREVSCSCFAKAL